MFKITQTLSLLTLLTLMAISACTPRPSNSGITATPACFAPREIFPFAFMPDNKSILLQGTAGVQIINLDDLKEEHFLQAQSTIQTVALAPDGKILAWSLDDHTIQLVRISDQAILHALSGHTDVVTKLRFSPAGDLLVSASHDGWVRVWNLQGKELRSFQPLGEVMGIGISPDGSMLATVPFDGPVTLWDLNTLEKIKELGGSGGFDTSDAEFSPDGHYLATDLATGLFLWRLSDGDSVWDKVINSMTVTFSPDGRYLAYADISDNSKVLLIKLDGLQTVRTFEGHPGAVWGLFFSPNSQMLVTTDGAEIRIWQVEDGSLQYIGKPACP